MRFLIILFLLCIGGFIQKNYDSLREMAENWSRTSDSDPGRPKRQIAQTLPVTLYTLSYCGPCKILERDMTREGIAFTKYTIDKEPERQNELSKRLLGAGLRGGRIGMPIVFAGSRVFMGATPIRQIEAAIQ